MTRLTVVPTPEQAFARDTAGLERPAELGGSTIGWRDWKPCQRITHIDTSCENCRSGRTVLAHGTVTYLQGTRKRRPRQIVRYQAYGCLDCRHVEVADLYPKGPHATSIEPERVWVSAGQQLLF